MIKEQTQQTNNVLEDMLSGFLSMAIVYGVPILLLGFGLVYIYDIVVVNLDDGVRAMAAALLPLSLTLAFAKSNVRENTISVLSENRLVSFGFSFVLAIATAWVAINYSNLTRLNDVPIGVLAFSSTLALMVFGNDKRNKISFLHIGAVTGFMTYIILFGFSPMG